MPWLFRQLRDRFGVAASFGSLLRIHVWVVVGLIAIAAIKPAPVQDQESSAYNLRIRSDFVREVGADRNDWRGFNGSPADDAVFRIGWTGGSSLQSIGEGYYEFLPKLVRDRMPEVDGRPVDIDIYFLSGIRIWDEYVAVLEAIENDVDMLVITLNPLWVFNDEAIQGWSNLNPTAAARLVDEPAAWPLGALLLNPADVMQGLVGRYFDGVTDRWSYGGLVRDRFDDVTFLDRTEPPEPPAEISELARIAQMQIPVLFWGEKRDQRPAGLTPFEAQAALLQLADPEGATWNQRILGWMAQAVVDSGVPTFVYLAPISSESLADPDVDAAVRGIEGHLREYLDDFSAETVEFRPETLGRSLPPIQFNDLIHVGEAPPLADHVTELLCGFLTSQGSDPVCFPDEGLDS
jgi:hypothetical protein